METRTEPALEYAGRNALRKSSVRWWICFCLFLVTTISYIDRTTVGALWKGTDKDTALSLYFGLNDAHFGLINTAFTLAYALGFPIAGRLLDRYGARKVLAFSVIFWSLAAMGHAVAGGFIGLLVARFLLGFGEAATFPGCVKVAGEWLPKHERALGAGIFNAGANAGLALSIMTVGLAVFMGHWQGAFIATGAIGFLWAFLWFRIYYPLHKHPRVSEAERHYILDGQPGVVHAESLPWTTIIRQREAWPFMLGKFLTDPVWWFYVFWLVPFLSERFHYTPGQATLWLIYIYVVADIGSIFGGWFSGFLIKRGWDVAPARYTAMGVCASMMPLSILTIYVNDPFLATTFIALAAAGHQGMSSNLFTTTSDIFPAKNVGSINGMAGIFQGAGSMLMTITIGIMLSWRGTYIYGAERYVPAFFWAGFMHPLAVIVYFLILGKRFKPVDIDPRAPQPFSKKLCIGGTILALAGAAGLIWSVMNFNMLVELSNLKALKAPVAATLPASTTAPATATAPTTTTAPATAIATTTSPAEVKPKNQAMALSAITGTSLVILIGAALIYAGLPRTPKLLKSEDA